MDNSRGRLFIPTVAWRAAYPQASAGILAISEVENSSGEPNLEARKNALAEGLREKYGGLERADLRAVPVLKAYADYYKAFKKTYHLLLQLESVAIRGQPLPSVNPLVDVMFMAELDSLLLTAGHDLATVEGPVTLDIARGDETYTRLQGNQVTLKPGDMCMADRKGVISSIIYGPDRRTRIRPETRQVLYTVYAPAGIEAGAVRAHLAALFDLVCQVSPGSKLVELEVYPGPVSE